MKTTVKQFEAKTEERNQLSRYARTCEDNQDLSMELVTRVNIKEIDEQYFSNVQKVNVKFYIGYGRQYFREVYKVGKWYFSNGTKMTKGNGYRGVEEILEITDSMNERMLNDSYSY